MIKSGSTNNSIIYLIENELKKPLPGFEAQKKMIPQSRLISNVEPNGQTKKSGVLLLLYRKNNILNLVFIRRAFNDSVHSGQIAFPGGKFDETDKDLIETSLRETHEEIGVNPAQIKILGNLSTLFIPVSNYFVYPHVGYSYEMPDFIINVSEVAGIIEIPLLDFLHPKSLIFDQVEVRGVNFEAPMFKIGGDKIWGATAMILKEFIEILSAINFKD